MGVVDRTCEFRQVLMELSSKGCAAGVCSLSGPVPQAQSELNAWSAEIGSQIHQTSLKVHELRKMAKRKGIFEDKTSEIQELTYSVKKDIETLNKHLEALEQKAKNTGPNRNYQAHSSNMVETLKTRLLGVTKDFKDALEMRTKALEQQDTRRNLWQGPGANTFGQQRMPAPSGNPDDLEGGPGGAQAVALQSRYHSSRAEAVQSVQRTIGELAQMFQKMAVMVTAQEEMIQRIDQDIDSTLDNVNTAQDDLLKYFHHISSNRGLIIKVFLILIFFVVFFVVFLA
uniref:t-SNARE coiled-coil homology domain-containing protein n=1 Tax=Pyrodinium bahamense TaxID=73915 RepID=A0A7S0B0Z0_9DINO|mmetsp:Transcript_45994/g.127945  ORF Transcript_45994/g.127945 Transcript_45994/m.127945 type:complete len:285 (+) Transcript_45994:54-908(+)